MTDDIVKHLRDASWCKNYSDGGNNPSGKLMEEAAEEITSLRAENERMYSLLVEAQDYIDDIYDELYIAIGKELEVQDYLRFAKKALGETG